MSFEAVDTDVENVRHICGISGGKDSTALAIYLRGKVPNMEYVFCDTGAELPETYEFLDKLEAYMGQEIVRLNSDKTFEQLLELYGGYLPSVRARWCTKAMKLIPLEKFFGDDLVYSYIAIRADENRDGYVSKKPNIKPVFPFKEDGLALKDIQKILDDAGMGMPKYYEWRSRSGCYFCFFQQKKEWVGLLRKHPDLFEKARAMEKVDGDKKFTWVQGRTLDYIVENQDEIMRRAEEREKAKKKKVETLFDMFGDEDGSDDGCTVCTL
jgi:hypothetical protein